LHFGLHIYPGQFIHYVPKYTKLTMLKPDLPPRCLLWTQEQKSMAHKPLGLLSQLPQQMSIPWLFFLDYFKFILTCSSFPTPFLTATNHQCH
jgi:hypothetical protein